MFSLLVDSMTFQLLAYDEQASDVRRARFLTSLKEKLFSPLRGKVCLHAARALRTLLNHTCKPETCGLVLLMRL